jgi:hypothetical protein
VTAGELWAQIIRSAATHAVVLGAVAILGVLTAAVTVIVMRRQPTSHTARVAERAMKIVWYGLVAVVLTAFLILAVVNNR